MFSGPQPGEKLSPLRVIGIYGEFAGQEVDLVDAAGQKTILFAIVHHLTRLATDLMRALMDYGETCQEDGRFPAMILLAEDRTEGERRMKRAVYFRNCRPPAEGSVDGGEGQGGCGLNRNCMMTVLVGKNRTVTRNFALIQPGITDAMEILRTVTELVDDEVPTTANLDFMKLHSRVLPVQICLCHNGKPTQDPQLRNLICSIHCAGDDQDSVVLVAREVENYVGTDPVRKKSRQCGQDADRVPVWGKSADHFSVSRSAGVACCVNRPVLRVRIRKAAINAVVCMTVNGGNFNSRRRFEDPARCAENRMCQILSESGVAG